VFPPTHSMMQSPQKNNPAHPSGIDREREKMDARKQAIANSRKAFIASKKNSDATVRKTAQLRRRWQEIRKLAGLKHEL
jgi:hypothetical protein